MPTPSSAPTGAAPPWLCWKIASRKNTDSSPSRATAKKVIPISAQVGPRVSDSAASISCSIVARIERAALRIQNTIESSTTTAQSPISASKISWAFCGSPEPTASTAAPTKSDIATARNTPTHTVGSHSPRPVRAR